MSEQEAPAVFDLSQVKPIESSVAQVKVKPICRQPFRHFVDPHNPATKPIQQLVDRINDALRAEIDPTKPLYSNFYLNENGKRVFIEDQIFVSEYGESIQTRGQKMFDDAMLGVTGGTSERRSVSGRPDAAPEPIRYPGPPDLSKSVPPPLNGEIASQLRSLCRICQGTLLGADPIPHDCSQNQF